MGLVLRLVETRADGGTRSIDVLDSADRTLRDIADLGLTLPEAKRILARVQQAVVAPGPRPCSAAAGVPELRRRMRVKDWRPHQIATLFGTVTVRLPRFRCPGCGRGETGVSWPAHCRSTPELDQLQARLSALMTYRVAAACWRTCCRSRPERATRPCAAARSRSASDCATRPRPSRRWRRRQRRRSLSAWMRPTSAAATRASGTWRCASATSKRPRRPAGVRGHRTSRHRIAALVRRALDAVGRTGETALTAFTDGCSGLRSILAAAGITEPPIADWFHLSMRLQHARQAVGSLPADAPDQARAREKRSPLCRPLLHRSPAWGGVG